MGGCCFGAWAGRACTTHHKMQLGDTHESKPACCVEQAQGSRGVLGGRHERAAMSELPCRPARAQTCALDRSWGGSNGGEGVGCSAPSVRRSEEGRRLGAGDERRCPQAASTVPGI